MSRGLKPYIYCCGDGVYPISARVSVGDRRLGLAVEPPEEGEAPGEVEAPREAPGEGPPACTGVMSREPGEGSTSNLTISREPGEALGEARPKCGFSDEHPVPYMFEQELASCEAKESGIQWFGIKLTGVDE